ncbi:MAG: twin-arginine translocase TatA/TatE family subunit [Coriobacteriia bacterium]|nr:twin-arginine translocase TatA/TatE family subunit [Coriobacteriia bacterium]
MKIGPFGGLEILIIAIVIFLVFFVFGPKNMPKLGTAFGKAIKNFREGMGAGKKDAEEESQAKQQPTEAAELVEVIDKPAPGSKPAPSAKQAEKESAE